MAQLNHLRDGTYEVEGRIFNNKVDAFAYMRFCQMRERDLSVREIYSQQMMDDWGNPLSEGTSISNSPRRSEGKRIGNSCRYSEGTSITNTNISNIGQNRGVNIANRVRDEIVEVKGKLRTDLRPELARELQRAKNLQKGLEDWGDVFTGNSDMWYQKEVEEKKAAAEKELKRMKAKLMKQGVNINDELPTFVPQETAVKPKENSSRKIFILDEE